MIKNMTAMIADQSKTVAIGTICLINTANNLWHGANGSFICPLQQGYLKELLWI